MARFRLNCLRGVHTQELHPLPPPKKKPALAGAGLLHRLHQYEASYFMPFCIVKIIILYAGYKPFRFENAKSF